LRGEEVAVAENGPGKQIPKPRIQRINGYLNRLHLIVDSLAT
jgi:hypothetical protein